jgi:hypothetical protein
MLKRMSFDISSKCYFGNPFPRSIQLEAAGFLMTIESCNKILHNAPKNKQLRSTLHAL